MSANVDIKTVCQEAIARLAAGAASDAQEMIARALAAAPADPQLHCAAGSIALAGRHHSVAIQHYEQALSAHPDFPEALLNLGFLRRMRYEIAEARQLLERCVALVPSNPVAWLNLTSTYVNEGDAVNGEAVARRGLQHCPTSQELRWNLALLLLEQGRWEEGWREYACRFHTPFVRGRRYRTPGKQPRRLFDISHIRAGDRILCHGEQGLGDEVLFASMLREFLDLADRRGAAVVLDCNPRLQSTFQRTFQIPIVQRTHDAVTDVPHPVDWIVPIGDLGLFYRSVDADFPHHTGYLKACPVGAEAARRRLADVAGGRPLVGIAWTGGRGHSYEAFRSIPLQQWLPVFRENCCFVSLEYRDRDAEITALRAEHEIHLADISDHTRARDVDQIFSVIAALDLVIAVPTTVVHIAGALGKPCLIPMHHKAAWRECSSNHTLPWYPQTHQRFVRSAQHPDWDVVMAEVGREVRRRTSPEPQP